MRADSTNLQRCSFGVDIADFPLIHAINEKCSALPAFEKALPENQPDRMKSSS